MMKVYGANQMTKFIITTTRLTVERDITFFRYIMYSGCRDSLSLFNVDPWS